MATAQSNVNVNITANTADLDAKLAKQEAAIKTLDGAINVLGGSVELAASALVATGIASEESADKFEGAALAAIAFADGSKRVLDGVKSLNEGLKAYGGISKAAAAAQKALNASVLANPYVLAAAAVVALGTALAVLYNRQVEATEAEKSGVAATERAIEAKQKLKEQTDDLRQSLSEYVATLGAAEAASNREVRLLQAQGASESKLREARKKAVNERISDLNRQLGFVGGNAQLEEEINQKLLDARNELDVIDAEYNRKRVERGRAAAKKIAEDKEKADKDALDAERKFLDDSLKLQQDYTTKLNEEFEKRKSDRQALADYEQELLMEEFNAVLTDLEKRKKAGEDAAAAEASLLNAQLQLTQAVGDGVANLGAIFEQGTAAAKTAAIADIAINTAIGFIQALDIAQKSAKATGPAAAFAFPIFYASQIAAVLGAVASAKQVLAQTPGGSGGVVTTQPTGAIGSGTPRIERPDLSNQFGQGGFLAPGGTPNIAPQPPIQAYVLASDVTNGLQAYGQISRRRRFG